MRTKFAIGILLFLYVCWMTVCIAVAEAFRGQIEGIVIDEKGVPVNNAQVTAQFASLGVRRLIWTAKTSDHGEFRIDHLDWGPYDIYTSKEADGYPDTRFNLYRRRPAPRAVLSPSRSNAKVKVIIGPMAGVLVSSVRDATTHSPVPAHLIVQKADGSSLIYMSRPPDFRLLLPSDTDLRVEIRDPGYEKWTYTTGKGPIVRLKSGERIDIQVNLVRSPKAAKSDR